LSATVRFSILYGGWMLFLFLFFYFDTNPLSHWINEIQRSTLLDLLRFFLGEKRIEGIDILAHPEFRIYITQACNGLIPYYLYLAAVLAYPSRWRDRILWGAAGYLVISAVNVLRLLFVTAMVAKNPANFGWSHNFIGNLFLMVVGLGLFYAYIRWGRGGKSVQN